MSLFYQVPQAHVIIIERLGKYSKTMPAGLRMKLPFIDKPKSMSTWEDNATKNLKNIPMLIELAEQALDTKSRSCITKDNVEIQVDALIFWQITDVVKAVYEVDILPKSVLDTSLTALRSIIGSMDFDDAISQRNQINERILTELNDISKKWGIKINRVELQELKASSEASSAMLKQMTAEREKRANISEAEGNQKSLILEAEGKKQAMILEAEGQAEALTLLAKGEMAFIDKFKTDYGEEKAIDIYLSVKYLKSLENMNESSKIFLPLEAGQMINLLKNFIKK